MTRAPGHKLLVACFAALALAACGGDDEPELKCEATSCSGHGACSVADGKIVCACDEGYEGVNCESCGGGLQDKDGDGTCQPDCSAKSCGAGTCSDQSGTATCACFEGWTGAACEGCAAGYHLDYTGACISDTVCTATSCSGHGTCNDTSGTVVCACEAAYTGANCSACVQGYQDKDGNGTCLPDCESAALSCGDNGQCDDASGTAVCACLPGYAGEGCTACAEGYQDNDSNGTCTANCATAALSCGTHGHCDDASGTAACACDEGHTGEGCASCATGYQDNDGDTVCAPGCTLASADCGDHGDCDDSTGAVVCDCDAGYTGGRCADCASNYQDNDQNNTYLPNCASAGLSCGAHGECADASGTAACACDPGWAGPSCAACAPGYQPDGQGGCEQAPDCSAVDCGHGACNDSSGAPVCVCDTGYTGSDCSGCASGFTPDSQGGCDGTGATCASPLALPLVSASYTLSTVGSGDEYTPSCRSNDSSELVLQFRVAGTAGVAFETSGYDTIIYLRSSCAGPDLICDDDGGSAYGSRIETELTAGVYYLFLDGYANETGNITLDVEVTSHCAAGSVSDGQGGCIDDPCLPNPCTAANTVCQLALPGHQCVCLPGHIPNPSGPGCIVDPNPQGEGCGDAILLSGEGSVTGRTDNAQNDGSGSCGGSYAGPDRVYAFVAQARTRYQFSMSGYDTLLHLRRGTCTSSSAEIACNDDSQGTAAGIDGIVDPGTYYLFADGYYATGGSYTLDYSLRTDPCAGDPCPGTPECVAQADWSGFECVCPTGMVPYAGSCIDDPCQPNPCANTGIAHLTTCNAQLPGNYECVCNPGYIDDGAGGCTMDPNANEWTLMVFLNSDNNLDDFGDDDLAEMERVGSDLYVNLIVLHDSSGNGDTRMLRINRGSSQTLAHPMGAEVDMGRWESLRDFGLWTVQNYPARHYGLVVWNHGDGWRSPGAAKSPLLKGFSNDETNTYDGISITNGDYARALSAITQATGGKLDLVGFDACLMGMYEVAKATAPYAHYLVASSETEPAGGWSYDGFLPGLLANHNMDAATLGASIADTYYAENSSNSTQAVTNLDTIPALDAAVSGFADALMASSSLYSSISTVRNASQEFYDSDNIDLADFADRVAAMSSASPALRAAANAVAAQVRTSVVHNKAQSDYPGANGLAIYLPPRNSGADSAYYDTGATWSIDTRWDEFLQSFAQ